MSPKLPAVTAREVIRVARRLGFAFDYQQGSHKVFYRERDKRRVVIPDHAGKTLKPGTLKSILRDLEISTEEYLLAAGKKPKKTP